MPTQVILYQWPDSQICLDCKHNVGVTPTTMEMDEMIGPSASICIINHTKKFGKPCPKHKLQEVVYEEI